MVGQSSQLLKEFSIKFRLDELKIADFGNWALSLRPGQLTLGSMVLSHRLGVTNLGNLTPDDGQNIVTAFGWAEASARECFGAVRLNILCLMMQDPIVHFHILPRYDRPVNCAGRNWVDADWPSPPNVRPIDTEKAELHAILDKLLYSYSKQES